MKILVDTDHVADMITRIYHMDSYSYDEEERMILRKKVSVMESFLVLLDKFDITYS